MTGYESKKDMANSKLYANHWIELTKEQRQECVNQSMYHTAWSSDVDLDTLIDVVQQKLKDLNNG